MGKNGFHKSYNIQNTSMQMWPFQIFPAARKSMHETYMSQPHPLILDDFFELRHHGTCRTPSDILSQLFASTFYFYRTLCCSLQRKCLRWNSTYIKWWNSMYINWFRSALLHTWLRIYRYHIRVNNIQMNTKISNVCTNLLTMGLYRSCKWGSQIVNLHSLFSCW